MPNYVPRNHCCIVSPPESADTSNYKLLALSTYKRLCQVMHEADVLYCYPIFETPKYLYQYWPQKSSIGWLIVNMAMVKLGFSYKTYKK